MQPGDLCTIEDVAAYMPNGQSMSEAVVQRLITAASAAITRVAEREFATLAAQVDEPISDAPETLERQVVARRFPIAPWERRRVIPVGDMATVPTRIDILSATGAVVAADIDLAGVSVEPFNRAPGEPYTRLWFHPGLLLDRDGIVQVTAEWGWPQVPEDIRQACIAQVREWYVRDVAQFGDSFLQDEGSLPVRGRELSLVARDAARAYRHLMVR